MRRSFRVTEPVAPATQPIAVQEADQNSTGGGDHFQEKGPTMEQATNMDEEPRDNTRNREIDSPLSISSDRDYL